VRLVLDPGVLIAAAISPDGVCRQLLRRWVDGDFELVVSSALLEELEEVLLRPKFRRYLSESDAREFVHALAGWADTQAEDPPADVGITPDPDDDYLVSLARATNADALVSGDPDLTDLAAPNPPVLTPRAAMRALDRSA
jgi:uncharacterized protein